MQIQIFQNISTVCTDEWSDVLLRPPILLLLLLSVMNFPFMDSVAISMFTSLRDLVSFLLLFELAILLDESSNSMMQDRFSEQLKRTNMVFRFNFSYCLLFLRSPPRRYPDQIRSNPTKYDQIRLNLTGLTKSDRIRPNPTEFGCVRPNPIECDWLYQKSKSDRIQPSRPNLTKSDRADQIPTKSDRIYQKSKSDQILPNTTVSDLIRPSINTEVNINPD